MPEILQRVFLIFISVNFHVFNVPTRITIETSGILEILYPVGPNFKYLTTNNFQGPKNHTMIFIHSKITTSTVAIFSIHFCF